MWVPAADSCNQINIGKLGNLQMNFSFVLPSPNQSNITLYLAPEVCNFLNPSIDIDTGSTSTTRKWQIKVSMRNCRNTMVMVVV